MTKKPLRVLSVYGTRPEAIKMVPILYALEEAVGIESIIAVTGQHRDMLEQVHRQFRIQPDYNLEIMRDNQTLNGIAGRILLGLDPVIEEAKPDVVLVHGDTTSAMAAALAAFNRGIPVTHIEAGLRSGDLNCPFPEEANRKMIAQIARLHLAPTAAAQASLIREGVSKHDIVLTGNSTIDTLMSVISVPPAFTNAHVREMVAESESRPVVLVTMHRRENMGPRLVDVARAVAAVAKLHPECGFIWPGHSKPGIYTTIKPILETIPNVAIVEPLMYHEFIHLVQLAKVILTDSGGVQEEGVTVGTPVLVARDVTDRVEGLGAGLTVVGTNEARIIKELGKHIDRVSSPSQEQDEESRLIFGDGRAAERTVKAVLEMFG